MTSITTTVLESSTKPNDEKNDRGNEKTEVMEEEGMEVDDSVGVGDVDVDVDVDVDESNKENGVEGTNAKEKDTIDESTSKDKMTIDKQNSNETDKDNDIDTSLVDLTQPLKKGRTPYFIFQQEKRPQVVQELTKSNDGGITTSTDTNGTGKTTNVKASVTNVAKRIGQLWSNLTTEEKEVYHAKSRKEKEVYQRHRLALIRAGKLSLDTNGGAHNSTNDTGNTTTQKNTKQNSSAMNGTTLPVSRIRKICRLDPEVKGISKESTLLITKAAECFLEKIATETMSMMKLHNKRTLYAQDVADICSLKEVFFFLKDDIKDLVNEQKVEKKRKREMKGDNNNDINGNSTDDGERKRKVSKSLVMSGVKPLTSYFSTTNNKK